MVRLSRKSRRSRPISTSHLTTLSTLRIPMGKSNQLLPTSRPWPLRQVRPRWSRSKISVWTFINPRWSISPQTLQRAVQTKTLPCINLSSCTRATSLQMPSTWRSSWPIVLRRQVTMRAKKCRLSRRPSMRSSNVTRISEASFWKSSKPTTNTLERLPSGIALRVQPAAMAFVAPKMHWSVAKN